jgi:hypothetical protein
MLFAFNFQHSEIKRPHLRDSDDHCKSRPHHRTPGMIGMMIAAAEQQSIDRISAVAFFAQVHATHGQFLQEALRKLRKRDNLQLYQPRVIFHEPRQNEAEDDIVRGNCNPRQALGMRG